MNMDYENNLTPSEAIVELDDNELDVVAGGSDPFDDGYSSGKSVGDDIGDAIYNGVSNAAGAVVGFFDGLIFGD